MPSRAPQQLAADDADRMDVGFAVFNCHVNNARQRANDEFVAQFGQKRYDRHIAPYDEGIMALFARKPNQWQLIWAALVTAFVNERRKPVYVG